MSVHVLSAPIVAVEVLRSSALVRRRGPVPALDGEADVQLELAGLPLALLDSSVRVQLEPAEGCRVVDVHCGLHLPPPAERAPEDGEVKRLRREQTGVEQRRARAAQHVEEVMRLRPTLPPVPRQPGDERFVGDPVPAWLELAELLRERASEGQQLLRQLDERLREISEELAGAEERRAQASSAEPTLGRLSKRIRVQLDRGPAEARTLELSYQVPGTRWFPTYELHLARGERHAELVMNALLAQLTGEDWRDVELSLSTADLQRSALLASLPAWRIGRTRPSEPRTGWRSLPGDLDDLFKDYDRQRPPAPSAAEPRAIELPGRGPVAAHSPSAPTTVMNRRELEGVESGELDDAYTGVEERTWSAVRGEIDEVEEAVAADESAEAENVFISNELPAELLREMPPAGAARAAAPAGSLASGGGEVAAGKPQAIPEPAPAPVETAPADALLAYGELVLTPPEEAGRGQLRLPRAQESAGLAEGADTALGLADFQRLHELVDLECLDLPPGAISVEESAGPFAHRYAARLGSPLPSDGQVHRITVLRAEVPISLVHRSFPLLDGSVYRLARLQNPLERPLLAGPLDVFWDGEYLITTQLKTTPAGGSIESALGLEPCIRVARNVRHAQREGGLLGGRTVFDEEIVIEIESHLEAETSLELIERLPVSDDRKVEIKLNEEVPPAEPFEQKERGHPIRGGRRWRLTLAPGKKERCLLRYQIAVPAKNEIVGGGRRAS